MKGFVKSAHYMQSGGIGWVFIAGEDGIEYFGHGHNFASKNKHYKPGVNVLFDAEDNGRLHPDAVNIRLETPPQPGKRDELLNVINLGEGVYCKRLREPSGKEYSLIVKDNTMIMKGLPVFEKDMIWIFRRGPSGMA